MNDSTPKTLLLTQALELYVADLMDRGCTAVHIRSVRSRIGQFLKGRGGRFVHSVTTRELQEWIKELRRDRTEATVAGYTATQRAFWNWMYNEKLAEENVARKLRVGDYTPTARLAAPEEHVAAVAAALDEFADHRDGSPRDLRDALMVSLSLDSGARRGTMLNLRKDDVEVSLTRPNWTEEGAAYAVRAKGKTGVDEVIFFGETAEFFRRWLPHVPPRCPWVFSSLRTNRRLRPDAFSKGFVRVCKFAGVPVFRSHAIRKRNATEMIKEAQPKVAQQYLNHKQLATTMRHYVQTMNDDVYSAAAAVAAKRRQEGKFAEAAARLFRSRQEKSTDDEGGGE